MVVIMVVIASLCSMSFAATVGQALKNPETGWNRYDNTNIAISYTGKFNQCNTSQFYLSTSTRIAFSRLAGKAEFKFYGTKFRIISFSNSSDLGYSSNVQIKVDGVLVGSYSSSTHEVYQLLAYEKTDLVLGIHSVEITPTDLTTYGTIIDAIDIDDAGYLVSQNAIPAPTNLTAEAGSNKVTLNWTSVEGATSYNVKRATISGGEYTIIGTNTTNSAITFEDTGLTSGTTYYYVVSAKVNDVEGTNSIEVSATPMEVIPLPPTNLIAESRDKEVNLVWNPVINASGYNVKYSLSPDGEFQLLEENVQSNSFLDTGLENGMTYYYVVSVIVDGVESPDSNIASVTPSAPVIVGNNAILEITMLNGTVKEYDLTANEIQDFLTWYDGRSDGVGKAYYTFVNKGIVSPFLKKSEYIPFDKILSFEVNEYAAG